MSLVILVVLIAAVLGSVGITTAFAVLFFRTRANAIQGGSPNDLRLLQNEVQRLGEELDHTTAELARLREQMDFTERLLARGDDGEER